MTAQLCLVNPPAQKGRTHERAQSGGLGVARKLKPFEREGLEVLPHDFLYQAAVAEQFGHRVQLIDLPLERIYELDKGVSHTREVIARGTADQPGTTVWIGVRISIVSLRSDLEMTNRLKQAFPTARVFAFGNVLMTTHRHWLRDARFDYLFYGEPEAIIAEAMAADDPAAVPGVMDVATQAPPDPDTLFDIASTADYRRWRKVNDISTLPRAAWHLLELGRYAPHGRVSDLALTIPASRGCFMPCTMCAYSLNEGRQMRFRTPDEVLDEIEHLYRTYGTRQIRFRDPNFSANKPHLQAIAQGIIDRRLPLEAAAELSLELLDRELMELLYRAGIRTILTGVESNDPEIMRSIGQHVRINRVLEQKVVIAREVGLKVYTFFIIGTPEETWHTVRETFHFAQSLGTESTMTIMTPFPGTAMYWRALYENLLVRQGDALRRLE
jgi:anaerobic magnesium-protoporphyrin IX monomethyl ester cyclase